MIQDRIELAQARDGIALALTQCRLEPVWAQDIIESVLSHERIVFTRAQDRIELAPAHDGIALALTQRRLESARALNIVETIPDQDRIQLTPAPDRNKPIRRD